jgi:Ca2+:H+ antiporter
VSAGIALIPLAALLTHATEQISIRLGSTVGALLNVTFGNAPEMIITFIALRHGLYSVVKATIVGSLLADLLFVQGISFFMGGLRHHYQEYNEQGARIQSSMLMVAVISMILPSIFHNFVDPGMIRMEQDLNGIIAIVLLLAYAACLLFMLKTHPDYFVKQSRVEDSVEESTQWSVRLSVMVLLIASVMLAFLGDILVGSVQQTASTINMSQTFMGVVILALIGCTPETIAGIAMARKNKIDLTVGIAVGSSLQMVLFVTPLLVLASYFFAPQPMHLSLGNGGALILFLSVLIMGMIAGDGRSNWLKGVQLIIVYLLIALLCFFLPGDIGDGRIS